MQDVTLQVFQVPFVAFLLFQQVLQHLSHDQEYQFMNGTNRGVLMCVPCCTITLVTIQTPGLLRHVCAAQCVD